MEEIIIADKEKESRERIIIKTPTDLQRLKLEKLMQNPEKPIIIPETPKERGFPAVPDFVRNVMGSSAGAGSGEFHVYRHLRRKEYARQRYMKEKGERERLDDEYRAKLEENKKIAEEKTAKKRKKRMKRKSKLANKKKAKSDKLSQSESSSESSENETDKEAEDEGSKEKDNDTEGADVKQEGEDLKNIKENKSKDKDENN